MASFPRRQSQSLIRRATELPSWRGAIRPSHRRDRELFLQKYLAFYQSLPLCVQSIVTPEVKDGKLEDSRWFDTKRLEVLDTTPVMDVPTFEVVAGGQEKSVPRGL